MHKHTNHDGTTRSRNTGQLQTSGHQSERTQTRPAFKLLSSSSSTRTGRDVLASASASSRRNIVRVLRALRRRRRLLRQTLVLPVSLACTYTAFVSEMMRTVQQTVVNQQLQPTRESAHCQQLSHSDLGVFRDLLERNDADSELTTRLFRNTEIRTCCQTHLQIKAQLT